METENKKTPRKAFRRMVNKYTFVGLLFIVWMAFFDKYSMVEKLHLKAKISTLEKEKAYYAEKIKDDRRKKEELLGSRENLEKFAREQYKMKNENEEIFIVVKE